MTPPLSSRATAPRRRVQAAALAALAALTLVAAGCSTPASAEGSEQTPLADYEGGQRTFGQAYEYGNGLFVQIKTPVEFEPTEQTVGLGGEGVPVKIRVSITNGSRTDYKPHTLSATAVSGGVEATPLTDATAQIEVTGPSVEIRPAGVVAFDLAFLVADPSDVTLTVIPAIGGYQPVVYSTR